MVRLGEEGARLKVSLAVNVIDDRFVARREVVACYGMVNVVWIVQPCDVGSDVVILQLAEDDLQTGVARLWPRLKEGNSFAEI